MEPNYLRWSMIGIGLTACLGIIVSLTAYYIAFLIRRCSRPDNPNIGNFYVQTAQPCPAKLPNAVIEGSDGKACT